jgi:hypothetical protein
LKTGGKRISYNPNYRPGTDRRYDEALERMCPLAARVKAM